MAFMPFHLPADTMVFAPGTKRRGFFSSLWPVTSVLMKAMKIHENYCYHWGSLLPLHRAAHYCRTASWHCQQDLVSSETWTSEGCWPHWGLICFCPSFLRCWWSFICWCSKLRWCTNSLPFAAAAWWYTETSAKGSCFCYVNSKTKTKKYMLCYILKTLRG